MLVLTRKQAEKICIGDQIVITVIRTKGKTVRLGVEAPDNVSILRGEIVVRATSSESQAADKPRSAALRSTAKARANSDPRNPLPRNAPLSGRVATWGSRSGAVAAAGEAAAAVVGEEVCPWPQD